MKRNSESGLRPEIRAFIAACRQQNAGEAVAVVQGAFGDTPWSEMDLANLASAAFNERKHLGFIGILKEFQERFPNSLFPVQSALATVCIESGDLDQGTAEARSFLSKLKAIGALDDASVAPQAAQSVGNAILAATAAYTELGWRSYSLRILEFAKKPQLPIRDVLRAALENETSALRTELAAPQNAAIDRQWEEFYQSGAHFDELWKLCSDRKFEIMAKRLDLLETAIRFGQVPAWDVEFFLNVTSGKTPDGQPMQMLAAYAVA